MTLYGIELPPEDVAALPAIQQEMLNHVLAQNPGAVYQLANTVQPRPAVLVQFAEGATFDGVNILADGEVQSRGFSSYPAGRQAQYEHMVKIGSIDPDCALCERYAQTGGPAHKASPRCQSGGRAHCTCDTCF